MFHIRNNLTSTLTEIAQLREESIFPFNTYIQDVTASFFISSSITSAFIGKEVTLTPTAS